MKRLIGAMLVVAMLFSIVTFALAASEDTGFSDVEADAWYAEAVAYVRDNGIMSGTSATTFAPETTMTRAMLATVLYRASGSPAVSGTDNFTDTIAGAYYSDAVLWASRQGLVSGYGNGLFGTNDPVSREQIATILWRYTGSPTAERGNDFADESNIASYAAEAVDWARANGVINGMAGNIFSPKSSATRAQVATILRNYLTMERTDAPDDSEDSSRILVAYFSRVGNTNFASNVDAVTSASINLRNENLVGNNQLVAEEIQALVGGDLVEIVSEKAYPADYEDTVAQNRQEQQEGTLPAISTEVDLSNYDMIFVGYPIWAMTLPAPVKTFLSENDFSGKTVVPFCTHAGYGAGRTEAAIRELCPEARVLSVLAVEDDELNHSNELVTSWLDELGISETGKESAAGQRITITMGYEVITAELNDTPAAQEFARSLPITVSMTRMGEHEYYGALEHPLSENDNALQTGYTVGNLAFWTPGDLFALYFDEPETPPQGLMILGHITSDLSAFNYTGSRESVRIALVNA